MKVFEELNISSVRSTMTLKVGEVGILADKGHEQLAIGLSPGDNEVFEKNGNDAFVCLIGAESGSLSGIINPTAYVNSPIYIPEGDVSFRPQPLQDIKRELSHHGARASSLLFCVDGKIYLKLGSGMEPQSIIDLNNFTHHPRSLLSDTTLVQMDSWQASWSENPVSNPTIWSRG